MASEDFVDCGLEFADAVIRHKFGEFVREMMVVEDLADEFAVKEGPWGLVRTLVAAEFFDEGGTDGVPASPGLTGKGDG